MDIKKSLSSAVMQTLHDVSGSMHTLLSRTVLVPLLEYHWVVRPSRVRTGAERRTAMRFRAGAACWDDNRKNSYILEQLRQVLRHAQRQIPYYQRLFSKIGFDANEEFTFDDFAKLPILEREDAIAFERDLIPRDVAPNVLVADSTGGSTGKPVRIWLGPKELGWRDSGTNFHQARVGCAPGKRIALLWGHNLDPVASTKLKDRLLAFVSNYRWFDCFRLSPEVLDLYHRQMQSWHPDFIIAYAGALAALAEHVQRRGYQPEYPRQCCITGAEKLLPPQRRLIQDTFGDVFERYGARDIGLIAFQMDSSRALLEVDWPNLLVEPEASNMPSASLLVTKLNADGTGMIRYRVGDIASFPPENLPGHPAFLLHEVLGRWTDRIWLPDGRWISGLQIPHLMKDFPVREFSLLQHQDYSIDLQIVPLASFNADHREAIQGTVAANLPGLQLNIIPLQQIERTRAGKLRPVISDVRPSKKSPYAFS